MHYDIRKDDLQLIEAICQQHDIDFDRRKEDVLKRYYEDRIKPGDGFGEKLVEKIVEKSSLKSGKSGSLNESAPPTLRSN